MTDTFAALSDPTRRLLLDRLSEKGGLTLSALAEDLPMTRQAVAKHLAVLEAAELVATERDGRCKRHYLNPMPLAKMARRWLGRFEDVPLAAMAGFHGAPGAVQVART
ncbi:metalloregulator ArsR/SmtB family transcription factor [Qipengyuania citrea]|jgi:DNA-binding transcriptional ArsR family regulator|uniref:Metalloregulator ArsR/SmtB family transcription factor n=3 Tax=Qipengyuania TaxID=1855416 RepID=A0ABY4U2F4_9SPHN|nr:MULTISPECIES: metalloregulator ArsR/SmtB family transcription factor [Erythrobacteraceae]MAB45016.1 transcriptional regulator [Sphingomonadaceae bacterium]MAG41519.1 transcriptional regulator [Erythrobacteraceae bacterium]MCH2498454.1 metalloregulator ArsR/SmtB family transcription factor [Erythrobacter sp.]MEC7954225.1 metalloregulator ArsR/SmtB family transcription factor [Pseudomonadota bacterium]QPL38329.1 winged helix-turn-helix transcriptional regulator [Erythrobacter sp. A30-3]|tara:strand:- start:580 stop:903 length:324 start_codon:yes stop_codon:yes gene_type:complete